MILRGGRGGRTRRWRSNFGRRVLGTGGVVSVLKRALKDMLGRNGVLDGGTMDTYRRLACGRKLLGKVGEVARQARGGCRCRCCSQRLIDGCCWRGSCG